MYNLRPLNKKGMWREESKLFKNCNSFYEMFSRKCDMLKTFHFLLFCQEFHNVLFCNTEMGMPCISSDAYAKSTHLKPPHDASWREVLRRCLYAKEAQKQMIHFFNCRLSCKQLKNGTNILPKRHTKNYFENRSIFIIYCHISQIASSLRKL